MKNPLKYLNLWQKKRDELPVDLTPEQDWIKMQSVLDKHLPVVPRGHGSSGGTSAAGFKAIYFLVVTLSAAAAVYYFTYVSKTKQRHHAEKHFSHKSYAAHPDSLSNINTNKHADSLKTTEKFINKKDSLSKSKTTAADPGKNIKNENLAAAEKNVNGKKLSPGIPGKQGMGSGSKGKVVKGNPDKNFTAAFGNVTNKAKGSSKFRSGAKQRSAYGSSVKGPLKANRLAKENRLEKKYQNNINNKSAGLLSKGTSPANESISKKSAAAVSALNTGTVNKNAVIDSSARINKKIIAAAKKSNAAQKQKKSKTDKSKNQASSNFDFGILTGINSSGSFTVKNQNSNFYGSLPVDVYFGLFAAYNKGGKWGMDMQVRALNPQKISGSYTHANGSNIDSGQTLKVSDSRKAYFVSIPVRASYKINSNISVKAGPVINIPVKQLTGTATLLPANLKTDTNYYPTVISQLKNTTYQQKINFGLSGGVSVTYKRLFLEAAYSKNLSGYNVSSGFGNYKSNAGGVQVTIGFSLKSLKNK